MRPAILIHGPTASGKTQLSIDVARKLDGEIVNADSMQVYRDLRVISARPSAAEMDGVPHHLFGHVDAARRYSTGDWLEDAKRREARKIRKKIKKMEATKDPLKKMKWEATIRMFQASQNGVVLPFA